MTLLDTHVVLWWLADERWLSRRARGVLVSDQPLLISPISCWEVATLVEKGRVTLDRDVAQWTQDLLAEDRVREAALSPAAATQAGLLGSRGFHGDPADRMLYATAWELGAAFVTRDERIQSFSADRRDVEVIW